MLWPAMTHHNGFPRTLLARFKNFKLHTVHGNEGGLRTSVGLNIAFPL